MRRHCAGLQHAFAVCCATAVQAGASSSPLCSLGLAPFPCTLQSRPLRLLPMRMMRACPAPPPPLWTSAWETCCGAPRRCAPGWRAWLHPARQGSDPLLGLRSAQQHCLFCLGSPPTWSPHTVPSCHPCAPAGQGHAPVHGGQAHRGQQLPAPHLHGAGGAGAAAGGPLAGARMD